MRMVRAASEAPATPATRLRFETRPSLAPSTAARTVLPAIERWLACNAAHDGVASGGAFSLDCGLGVAVTGAAASVVAAAPEATWACEPLSAQTPA